MGPHHAILLFLALVCLWLVAGEAPRPLVVFGLLVVLAFGVGVALVDSEGDERE